MELPTRVQEIVFALYEANKDLAHATGPETDEKRRRLARMIAEQARFECGPSWGHKSADPTRPPSKDAIAQIQPNSKLFAWDLFDGTTRKPAFHDSIDITDQHFIVVPPVDHLGVSVQPEPNPAPPTEPPPAAQQPGIGEQLAAILHEMAAYRQTQDAWMASIGSNVEKLLKKESDMPNKGTGYVYLLGGTRGGVPVTIDLIKK